MNRFPSEYEIDNGIFLPARKDAGEAFSYSDGKDFEARIREIITSARDRSLFSPEIRNGIWDWRSACHLSPVRANILRPLEAICRNRVLELGAGCGIITRYLGELGGQVTALEASLDRAGITRVRTEDLDNVDVICDRIELFNSQQKFDVVTMIGVLQYARLFSNFEHGAELKIIDAAARQLSEHGVLVIAIQNKLALKSMAGTPEPNVGLPYFGVENHYGPDTIIRFGLDELKATLASRGLAHQAVLLPFPDYHMPVTILNELAAGPNAAFHAEPLLCASVGRDRSRPDWVRPQFSLERAWEGVHSSGATWYLSNAFLVVAGRTERALAFHREMKEYAWHYSVDRHPGFAIQKRFVAAGDEVLVIASRLRSTPPPDVPLSHNVVDEAYISGRLWWQALVQILNRPGWSVTHVADWVRPWMTALHPIHDGKPYNLEEVLPGKLFDCTPLNCVQKSDGALTFIDREWEVNSTLTLGYLVLRGLFGSFISVSSCSQPAPGTPIVIIDLIVQVLKHLGVELTKEHIELYVSQEVMVQAWVMHDRQNQPSRTLHNFVHCASLDCRVPPAQLEGTIGELEQQLECARSEIASAHEQIHLLRQSLSWRVMAPARTLSAMCKKLLSSLSRPPRTHPGDS